MLPSFSSYHNAQRKCVLLSSEEEGTPVDGVFLFQPMVLEVLILFSFENVFEFFFFKSGR